MKCSRCGESIPSEAAFCPQCGAKIEEPGAGEQSSAPSRTARLGACARSLSVRLGDLIKRTKPVVLRCFAWIGKCARSFYAWLGGRYAKIKPVVQRCWGRRAFRIGVIAVAVVFVAFIGIRLCFRGRNGEAGALRSDDSFSVFSGPSASETLEEFFELLESTDPDDHCKLEDYILFPSMEEVRESLDGEELRDFDRKYGDEKKFQESMNLMRVMLRSGAISLGWKEVQMEALPASINLTTIGEERRKDGVVLVKAAFAAEGIVLDESKYFPVFMRKSGGDWKIDFLSMGKAVKDGTLEIPDWLH